VDPCRRWRNPDAPKAPPSFKALLELTRTMEIHDDALVFDVNAFRRDPLELFKRHSTLTPSLWFGFASAVSGLSGD
jgi:hypothetical protein